MDLWQCETAGGDAPGAEPRIIAIMDRNAPVGVVGLSARTPIAVESKTEELVLRPAILAENHVSSRKIAGGIRPIIDIVNQALLRGLAKGRKTLRRGDAIFCVKS